MTNIASIKLMEDDDYIRLLELELLLVDEVGEYDHEIAKDTLVGLVKAGFFPEGKHLVYRYKFIRSNK